MDGGGPDSRVDLGGGFFDDPDCGFSIDASDSLRCRLGCNLWVPVVRDEKEWRSSGIWVVAGGAAATDNGAVDRVVRAGRSRRFISKPSWEMIDSLELAMGSPPV